MRITCLGTGTPEPHVRRASSGYLIEVADDVILFDCGGGVFDRLVQAGKRPSDLTHIFFSHLHTDHFIDYGRLLHAAWDEGKADIQVIGPAPVAQITERLFGRDGAYAHDLIARTELPQSQQVWLARGGALPRDWPKPVLTEVEPGFSWEGDGWRVTSCEVPHAQPFLTCMALRIDCHGRSFVFSGDAGRSKPLERLAEGADLLIHWLYALGSEEVSEEMRATTPPPAEIGAMATRAGVGQVWLTHFRRHMDTDAGHAEATKDLSGAFKGPCGVVEDLDVFDLTG